MELPSKLQIDDKVSFIPMERHCQAMHIEKEELWGTVVSVKFTKAKVWYDVICDYHGKIFDMVASNNVWIPERLSLAEVPNEN